MRYRKKQSVLDPVFNLILFPVWIKADLSNVNVTMKLPPLVKKKERKKRQLVLLVI